MALVVLIVLAAISYGVSFLPLGAWETPIAIGISVAKGTVVLLIFMHLLEQAVTKSLWRAVPQAAAEPLALPTHEAKQGYLN